LEGLSYVDYKFLSQKKKVHNPLKFLISFGRELANYIFCETAMLVIFGF